MSGKDRNNSDNALLRKLGTVPAGKTVEEMIREMHALDAMLAPYLQQKQPPSKPKYEDDGAFMLYDFPAWLSSRTSLSPAPTRSSSTSPLFMRSLTADEQPRVGRRRRMSPDLFEKIKETQKLIKFGKSRNKRSKLKKSKKTKKSKKNGKK